MSSSTKRQRTSSDNDDDIHPPAAVLSNPAPVVSAAAAAVVAAEPQVTQIQYGSDIAKLLHGDMQKDDEHEVETAMDKLTDLFEEDNDDWKENRDEALSLGALGIVLLVMRKWTQNEAIQTRCCYCFVIFSYDNPNAEIRVSIAKSGGIEAIIDAMKTFANSAWVQHSGCGALGNIFLSDDEIVDNAMARFVNDLNGVKLAVKAMEKFQDDVDVQEFGCFLFERLSWDNAHRDALKKAGAVSAVGKAMEKHDNEKVQNHAYGFLKNIVGA